MAKSSFIKHLNKATFVPASDVLDASYERFSNVRSSRIPSRFAKILIPFSLPETAKRVPSLLKRMRGLAFDIIGNEPE